MQHNLQVKDQTEDQTVLTEIRAGLSQALKKQTKEPSVPGTQNRHLRVSTEVHYQPKNAEENQQTLVHYRLAQTDYNRQRSSIQTNVQTTSF